MIHAALVSVYPTEAAARAAFDPAIEEPYLGVWRVPNRFAALVHLFGDDTTAEQLVALGYQPQGDA